MSPHLASSIWTALPDVLEGYQSGTSFAAPHVTAILAAIHGRVHDRSKEGFLRALAIRDLGQAGRDRIYGRGLVMAPNAMFGRRAQRMDRGRCSSSCRNLAVDPV